MTTWQVILSVVTIVMSGVVAAMVTFKLNARREDRQFRRQRLEHLFRSFMGACKQLGGHWLHYICVMTGKIDYNEALDMTIESGKDDRRDFQNLEMLVSIYWPELQMHVDALKKARDDAESVLEEHKARYKAGRTRDRESFDAIGHIVKRLEDIESSFADAVRLEAARLR